MTEQLSGKIVSTQLGDFNGKPYGYISLELPNKTHVTLKVDAYTKYETLDIGKHVIISAENLGNTTILVARSIIRD